MTQRHIVRLPAGPVALETIKFTALVAVAEHLQCILWPGFGISWKHSCEWRQRPFQKSRQCGSASKWLTTSYNILQLLARYCKMQLSVVSCRCRVSLKSLLAFRGWSPCSRRCFKRGCWPRWEGCSATLSDNSIESREAVLFRDCLFVQAQADGRLNPECCRHLQAHGGDILWYIYILIILHLQFCWGQKCMSTCEWLWTILPIWNVRKHEETALSKHVPHDAKLIRLELQGPFDFLADANVLEVRFPSSVN